MSKTPDLKPCPFCGESKVRVVISDVREYMGDIHALHEVECLTCGVGTCKYTTVYSFDNNKVLQCKRDGRQMAIDAWNRRATQ